MKKRNFLAAISLLFACLILIFIIRTDNKYYRHASYLISQNLTATLSETPRSSALTSLADFNQKINIEKKGVVSQITPAINMNWYTQVIENIKKQEYEINYQKTISAYQSPNRAQNLRFTYNPNGFSVRPRATCINDPGLIIKDPLRELINKQKMNNPNKTIKTDDWTLDMKISGFGKGNNKVKFMGQEFIVDKNKAYIEDRSFRIEYENNCEGMRQNFIVKEKPEGEGLLEVALEITSDLAVNVATESLTFVNKNGEEKMRYNDLRIYDANGRILDGYFERYSNNKIMIAVNDVEAPYPITIDPISKSPNWTAESNQVDASLGVSVASAGDVNGDGYSDVIVGAPVYDNGETDEGCAFLYYGSKTGLSNTANWRFEGNQTSANLGYSVATAGNVNKDGYSDVIIGAPGYTNGQQGEGRAFVFYGSTSGLSAVANWTAEINSRNAYFGGCVATAGDVNGDHISDVIIAAPNYTNGQYYEGSAYVYYGSESGLSASYSWSHESNQQAAYYGRSVASAGDVNGDGVDDIIVGAYMYDNGQSDEGQVYVYYGSSTSGVSTSASWTAESNQASGYMGYSVASAGDLNKDGCSEVIIGAPGYSNSQSAAGAAFVFNGSHSGLSQTSSWSIEGDQANAWLGYSVSSAGDVNGDGFGDLIIGSYSYDNGEKDEGRAYIYFGSANGLGTGTDWMVEGNQDSANVGCSVASAGDVNKDGYNDVIIGAPGYSNGQSSEGAAFAYYGANEMPVELTAFKASVKGNDIELYWQTATEVNNFGFELQRCCTKGKGNSGWEVIGFIQGAGNSNSPKEYSFTDKDVSDGKFSYRLKQIDNSGIFKFSWTAEVSMMRNLGFYLLQNSPNPCNPVSEINYSIPENSHVILKVYDMLGKEVATLVDEEKESGHYKTIFNAATLSSGIYIYALRSNGLSAFRKMTVMK